MNIETSVSEQSRFIAPDARILVVDDNSMNLKVFSKLLKNTQIQVAEAESGSKCLDIISRNHFDMIFMDHMMPEMDGIETFRRLRNISGYSSVPVIVLTANADDNARDMYIAEGFTDYIVKPVKPDVLMGIISKYMEGSLLVWESSCISEAADKTTEYPVIDGIDWNVAESHFTDHRIMMETLEQFYTTLYRDADRIDSLYNEIYTEEGLVQYRIFVHSMKSSAALVGLVGLSSMAQQLERAADAGDVEYIRKNHGDFVDMWVSYIDVLSPVFTVGRDCTEFDIKYFVASLERINEAAEMLNVEVMDSEMNAIATMTIPWNGGTDKIRELQVAVVDLDDITISRIVAELIDEANKWIE